MGPVTRRKFVKAGLTAAIGSQLGIWTQLAEAVDAPPTGSYDIILVGGGTAGAIVAAKLVKAAHRNTRILIIEAGGNSSATIGGTQFPPWLPSDRHDLTIFDVPGESQMAFAPLGSAYELTETPFTFQGIGLGGNSMFNGMLFQTNPP